MNSDVVMAICAPNMPTFNQSLVAIRTLKASTGARILIMGNNTPNEEWRKLLRWNCELLGCKWSYFEEPFSLSKYWNMGADLCPKGDYIAYANADAIFYPFWFENLVRLWEKEPDYFTVVPFSFDCRNMPCERQQVVPIEKIVPAHNPAGAVQVFKRSSNWRWDEQFVMWEMDADVTFFLKHNNLSGGVAFNSRVDHLIHGYVEQIDAHKHFNGKYDIGAATSALKKKWGLP
jgi:hypothetical protein